MPSLSEVMERATSGLHRLGDVLDESLRPLARLVHRHRPSQPYASLLKGVLWIAATVALDRLAGHPPVLQLLYLAPIWIAFETAGLAVAALLAGLAVPVASVVSAPAAWGVAWDLLIRSAFMASLVVIMIFHERRYRTTRESARRDGLTGALNRAGFEAAAREAIDAALAARRTLTLAVVDCDDFKALNDTKGHAFGDGVLRTLVRLLGTSLPGATLGRTGGDEFVIVDPSRDAAELRKALRLALDGFTDATIVMGRRSTFTVCIAALGPDGMRYESLLEAADRDMYRGKFERFGDALLAPSVL